MFHKINYMRMNDYHGFIMSFMQKKIRRYFICMHCADCFIKISPQSSELIQLLDCNRQHALYTAILLYDSHFDTF